MIVADNPTRTFGHGEIDCFTICFRNVVEDAQTLRLDTRAEALEDIIEKHFTFSLFPRLT